MATPAPPPGSCPGRWRCPPPPPFPPWQCPGVGLRRAEPRPLLTPLGIISRYMRCGVPGYNSTLKPISRARRAKGASRCSVPPQKLVHRDRARLHLLRQPGIAADGAAPKLPDAVCQQGELAIVGAKFFNPAGQITFPPGCVKPPAMESLNEKAGRLHLPQQQGNPGGQCRFLHHPAVTEGTNAPLAQIKGRSRASMLAYRRAE